MIRALILLLIFFPSFALATGELLSPPDAWKRAEAGELTIIDIRTPPEWAWTGVPKTSKRATWWKLTGEEGFLDDVLALTGGDRDMPIALICAAGVRSSDAARFLISRGFSNVSDIGEGMMGGRAGPGWLERKLPLE